MIGGDSSSGCGKVKTRLAISSGAATISIRSIILSRAREYNTITLALRDELARAIDELNARLDISIQPFKLTERRVLIDRLVWDPDVLSAVDEHCRETGMPRDAAMAAVTRYAREIVPSFSAFTYFRIGARVSKAIAESFYRVRLGAFDKAALARVGPEATVVFVMNHRSNMDYVLVTWLAAERSALSYAVGEWARVWPLSRLIRAISPPRR